MKTSTIKNLIATTVIASGIFFITGIDAEARTYTGEAGETSTWTYDDVANTIVISGTGKTKDYLSQDFPFSHGSVRPDVTFENGITEIGYQSFNCPIGNLEIAPSVKTIDDQAFMCSIDDDELVLYAQNIGDSAFTNLGGVDYIEVVNATVINSHAFCGLTKGNTIKFDKAVTFANNAISNCNGASIELPQTLTSVGSFEATTFTNTVFYGYRNFASINALVNAHKADYVNYTDLYDMSNKTMEISADEFFYTGSAIQPEVRVTYALTNSTLTIDPKNYTVSYSNNTGMTSEATVTVTGKGNYNGSISKSFKIYGDLSQATVNVMTTEYEADGTAKEPGVEVRLYGERLIEGVDYTVVYSDNVEAGQATITINALSNLLRNSVEAHFEIVAPVIEEEEVVEEENNQTQNQQDNDQQADENQTQTQEVAKISIEDAIVTLNETVFSYDGSRKEPQVTVTLNGTTLVENKDYGVSYKNNINIGTASVTIIGVNSYTGTATYSFEIISGSDNVFEGDTTLVSDTFNFSIIDGDEVELISSNKKTKNVVIPGTVTSSDGTTYRVTSIGNKAFYKNSKMETLVVPNSVTSIENNAFYGCTNLKSVKIGKGLEVLGSNSFRKCTKLETITLPKSIDEIGKGAFYGCKKLKTINIQSSDVVDISANAFKGTSKKLTINVPNKLIKKYQKKLTKKTGFVKKTMKIK